tara:strand:+ start:421 stop:852 length:432 start_codon:yes stop_codon:yes gene_type:complete
MSVRIVRLRNGEDVICDLYEVSTPENKDEIFALQLRKPYSVYVSGGMNADVDGEIHKLTEPEITLEPWMPLLAKDSVMIKMDEVVTAYETYDAVLNKYNELVGATSNGRGNDEQSVETDLAKRETRVPTRNSDSTRRGAQLAD